MLSPSRRTLRVLLRVTSSRSIIKRSTRSVQHWPAPFETHASRAPQGDTVMLSPSRRTLRVLLRVTSSRSIIKRSTRSVQHWPTPFETHASHAPQGDTVMVRSDAKHRVSKHHQNGAREACNIGPRPSRRALRALLRVTVLLEVDSISARDR